MEGTLGIKDIMPADGRYNGDVGVSLQSRANNSSIGVTLKNPNIKKHCACWRLWEGDKDVSISNVGIENIEQVAPRIYEITYDKSNLVVAIVFYAA